MKFKEYLKENKSDKRFGYKIVNYDGNNAYSIADHKIKYSLKKNHIELGNIFLGTSKRFAVDYYSTGSDDPEDPQELILTYEYSLLDVVKGNPDDKDYMTGGSEIIVKRAKLIAAYNLTKDKKII